MVTVDEVKHLAKLANLDLTNEEIEKYSKELSKVISYISELQEVNTEGVEPIAQVTGKVNEFKGDIVDPTFTLSSNDATSQTNSVHNDMFKVDILVKKSKLD